jgi:type I restriction-modification system DNA methylase subunit
MASKKTKKEALSVTRLITEVLINQLGIPFDQIVNDTTFKKYTGSDRPDLLISNVGYDKGQDAFVNNLLCYVEAKDPSCNFNDKDWKNAFDQGMKKAPKLKLPFFGVTNCHRTNFYNVTDGSMLTLNGNIISEFQTLDVFRIVKQKLLESPHISDIKTGVGTISRVSEAVFNKKLWELKEEYRSISFANNTQKIDFTIGLIALEYYEEKALLDGNKDYSLPYWSDCKKYIDDESKAINLRTELVSYIDRLIEDEEFKEFSSFIMPVKTLISGSEAKITPKQLQSIYPIIDSMKPLHGTGFDLFGAVYENFADASDKRDFGEFFTRRHYAHVLAELLLRDEDIFNPERKIKIMDPSCGTGGMLTESFKVLKSNYENTNTYTDEAQTYLSKECFYGIDIREVNISRTRLNMFLVGDGHTNMHDDNSLAPKKKGKEFLMNNTYDYIITNPPYGPGTIMAETDVLNSYRYEVAFLYKNIDLLKIGGKACIITPDGILENPSFSKIRQEFLETCKIEAIVSLPKFAFAPYTKEKTYAVFFEKKFLRPYSGADKKGYKPTGKFQSDPIWVYIIDNDGYANSDKRFPTRLRDEEQRWLHDEVSGYSDNNGLERKSILEQRWKNFDDELSNGTTWLDEKGMKVKMRKGGYIKIDKIKKDDYLTLLPEKYLRPYEPHYIDESEFLSELKRIEDEIRKLSE